MAKGIRFGRREQKPEVITLGQFVDSANESLGHADDADASLEDTVSAAKALAKRINMVREGKLEVRPPIAIADLDTFDQRAATIISLGEKASLSLVEAEGANRGAEAEPAFTGTGDLPKS